MDGIIKSAIYYIVQENVVNHLDYIHLYFKQVLVQKV